MKTDLKYKVYSPQNKRIAALAHSEDAALIVSVYGDGATVRIGRGNRKILWTEGKENIKAAESYDAASNTMLQRESQT